MKCIKILTWCSLVIILFTIFIFCINLYRKEELIKNRAQNYNEKDDSKYKYIDNSNFYYREKILSNTEGICYFNSMIILLSMDDIFVNYFKTTTFNKDKQPVSFIIKQMWETIDAKKTTDLSETIQMLCKDTNIKSAFTLNGGDCLFSLLTLFDSLFTEHLFMEKNNFFLRYSVNYTFSFSCKKCGRLTKKTTKDFFVSMQSNFNKIENQCLNNCDRLIENFWKCEYKECENSLFNCKKEVEYNLGQIIFIQISDTNDNKSSKPKNFPPDKIKILNLEYELCAFEIQRRSSSTPHSYIAYKERNKWYKYDGRSMEIETDYFNKTKDLIALVLYKQKTS